LQNGDVILQTSKSSQSAAIFLASKSAYTHMGLIEVNAKNQPAVVEAAGPVRTTALDAWIKRGFGGRITILRMPTLDAATA
jgi:Permuted papain-like amidase enzyme, YaeF/YiiX, C92 family